MSGYQDDRRRSSRDDRARERSPERRDHNSSCGRQRTYDGGHGGSDHGNHDQRSSRAPERLPDLPDVVTRPDNGGALTLDDLPLKATAGRPLQVALNHFQIRSLPIVKVQSSVTNVHLRAGNTDKRCKIFQYDLRFNVPVSSQRRGSEKVSAMQQAKVLSHPALTSMLGPHFVFDGVSMGWCPEKLMEIRESKSTTLDLAGHVTERPNQVNVMIRCTGTLNIRTLVNHIKAGSASTTDPAVEDCFKALNALYRQDPASRMITRPKSTAFFERAPGLMMPLQSTGGVLEALRGFHQAVQLCAGKLTMNVNVVVSAYYTPGLSAIDVVMAYAGVPPQHNIEQWASSHQVPFRLACERLVGMFFAVRHLTTGRNERKMRVMRISVQGSRETEFEEQDCDSGRAALTTVYDYFMRKYQISLRFANLPLLICKEGHFPMELCLTAAGERYKEPLNGPETSDFIRFATAPANIRSQQVRALSLADVRFNTYRSWRTWRNFTGTS